MRKRVVKKGARVFSMVIVVCCFCNWMQLLDGACVPQRGCSTALSYYTVESGDQLLNLVTRFQTTIAEVQLYNTIPRLDDILSGNYILFPFPCDCVDSLLGHSYTYAVQPGDTAEIIAGSYFDGLSKPDWIYQANGITSTSPPETVQVPVNCTCGNPVVDSRYGLFVTYSASSTDNSSFLASRFSVPEIVIQEFNTHANWNGTLSNGDILFIPGREIGGGPGGGLYPPFNFSNDGSSSNSHPLIVGVSVGGGIAVLLFVLVLCLCYIFLSRKKQRRKGTTHDVEKVSSSGFSGDRPSALKFQSDGTAGSSAGSGHGSAALSDFTVDKSVEFSFEELAAATNNFNVANKIGEGGYGAVYLATLRGQKLAVKRMNLQATREFMAELQVLTHVHHTNLVQLVGYCTVDSLFLIYEYVENGTLDRHLHGSHNLPPLSWPARVQIALDAARGLEYIHEHTKPTYIHRDVKSSNILIDKQLHAKVADFGLTKLTESGVGSFSLTGPTRLVGTFGYMSPEYARFGDVSPKVDVYSFGVVLFEIISAKAAIVRFPGSSTDATGANKEEQRALVTLFEEVLSDPEGKEKLGRLIDPALNGSYPVESAWKMAELGGACTQEDPELRPSMRTVVVALMTLSSATQDWDTSAFGSDVVLTGMMSGR